MIDATTREAARNNTHEATYELMKDLASNNYQWLHERARLKLAARVIDL